MREYIEERPDKAQNCAQHAAAFHVQIHSTEVTDLPPLLDVLTGSIGQAEPFDEKTRKAVLDVLDGLPAEDVLTHNDFYPNNIIMSSQGPVVIDWAIGTRGSSLADLARTWLISKLWIGGLEEEIAPEHLQLIWGRYWESYFHQYTALHPFNLEDFIQSQIVAVTASLVWGPPIAPNDKRVPFVKAALRDRAHPWLS